MKTYVFEVEIKQDDDGRWGAEIPFLPGCNAWGYTRKQSLDALQDTAQAFVEIMLEDGDPIPEEAGGDSLSSSALAVRQRDGHDLGAMPLAEFVELLVREAKACGSG